MLVCAAITSGEGGDNMTAKLHLTNEGGFTVEQVMKLVPTLLPYGWKLLSVRPAYGELYDFIMTVRI